ncbi:MAG: hypothetical protein WD512_09705 [Candidatus Paceibacterota bacterium]
MRFNLRQIKLIITDPLFYQTRLEKKLNQLSKKLQNAKNEFEQEAVLSELEHLLSKGIGSLLSDQKITESLERSKITNLVKSLVASVPSRRIVSSKDSYIQKLRRANQMINFTRYSML